MELAKLLNGATQLVDLLRVLRYQLQGLSVLQMWPGLIAKAKEGGLDVIQTYVFWNGHEPTRGVVRN